MKIRRHWPELRQHKIPERAKILDRKCNACQKETKHIQFLFDKVYQCTECSMRSRYY